MDEVLASDLAVGRDVDPEPDLLAHDLDRRPVEDRRQPRPMLPEDLGRAGSRLGAIGAAVPPEPVPNRHLGGPGIRPDRRGQHAL
jgi:hypothetical protein